MSELSVTGGRDVHTVRFPDATPRSTVDVLIVGAGPVGLAAAVELTSRGVRAAVIERARTATPAGGRDGPHPTGGGASTPLATPTSWSRRCGRSGSCPSRLI
ncbi:FAD-dependent oxidoreductase [Streptomyces sp. NPDC059755]|uniref:FAD-dependent oxidoreductase n=1 Tax=Streptomyces sp. NPDC059755 TaxID=3346934 RepID=UPI0036482D52